MSLLRILSFNIHSGKDLIGRKDLSRVHDLMEFHNVDIGVFQEMETCARKDGQTGEVEFLAGPERPYHFHGPTITKGESWYGNLIVSRYPIKRSIVHDLDTGHILEPRNAVDAFIKTPYRTIRVIGTHLSLSSVVRWWEINNLMELADQVEEEEEKSKHPVFFMGDINEWRWPSKLLRHLNEIMTPMPCGKTFPSFWPLFGLDRAWHDGPEIEASARVLDGPEARNLSDHLPILVEVYDLGA